MPHCPNCSYGLVFLNNRIKYKCAKCGKVFLPNYIENRDFLQWNKAQRETDKNNMEFEILKNKKPQLTPEERKLRTKELAQKRRLNNLETCREYGQKYYNKNREEILKKKKEYRKLAKDKYYAWRKDYRLKLAERTRLLGRINYWRREQARLAQEELEFSSYKPYNDNLDYSFSTFGISEQLVFF